MLNQRFEGEWLSGRLAEHLFQSRHLGQDRVVEHLEDVGPGPHVHEGARHVPT